MLTKSYICDRCGKTKEKTRVIDIPFNDRVVKDIGWITVHSRSGYSRNIDLCDNCLESFEGWYNSYRGPGKILDS